MLHPSNPEGTQTSTRPQIFVQNSRIEFRYKFSSGLKGLKQEIRLYNVDENWRKAIIPLQGGSRSINNSKREVVHSLNLKKLWQGSRDWNLPDVVLKNNKMKGYIAGQWGAPQLFFTVTIDTEHSGAKAFIDYISDKKGPLNLNPGKPVSPDSLEIHGIVKGNPEKEEKVEVFSTYKQANKTVTLHHGYAEPKSGKWDLELKKFPDGANVTHNIFARLIDPAGNHQHTDSQSVTVDTLPEAEAKILQIDGIKLKKNKLSNDTSNARPLITGTLSSKLKEGEQIEIWNKHRIWHNKVARNRFLGYATPEGKSWTFKPAKNLQSNKQYKRVYGHQPHYLTARVSNGLGKISKQNRISFAVDTNGPSIRLDSSEQLRNGLSRSPGQEKIVNSYLNDIKRRHNINPDHMLITLKARDRGNIFATPSTLKKGLEISNGTVGKVLAPQNKNVLISEKYVESLYETLEGTLFISVIPTANSNGHIKIQFQKNILKDRAGNKNNASNTLKLPFDTRTKETTPEDGLLNPIDEKTTPKDEDVKPSDNNPTPVPDDTNKPINAAKPSLKKTEATIAEDAKAGTTIIDLADSKSGKDLNADGDKLTYTIETGNDDGLFSIDPDSGVISIAAGKSLNYDTKRSHKLTVEASDGSQSGSAVITIKVTDVSGYPAPADTSPSLEAQTVQVNESIKPGDEIVDLSDESGGDTNGNGNALAYAISSGNEEQLFTINPSNGKITLSKEKVPTAKFLDYETQKSFVLGVSASAKGKTDTAQITVQVQNQTEQFNLGSPAPYSWGGGMTSPAASVTVLNPTGSV
ncbi:hypothetical protein KR100_15455 [Synechococcus sp. KORDI-100]|uniref:cadherin repeat domain-containing protein n=1 Tax=Synechococcus sp. KORDI-100 TaxID=1280380 RepID=UPI0004E06564|nr:cadherin repeat domain-containing protein [Synechococcus sp. KORDI-100]AII44741.1 hypothetical protein KR100_15455 [Synechococcus sp. KORDI-100]